MGFTWEEAEVAALDRHGWRRSVARCVQLDVGLVKVEVKVILVCGTSYDVCGIELATKTLYNFFTSSRYVLSVVNIRLQPLNGSDSLYCDACRLIWLD